jgi:hypothetical protein
MQYATPIERRIALTIVADAIAAGYLIAVHDGEEYALGRSKDVKAILRALNHTDHDVLVIRRHDGTRVGTVTLIWGNGAELISDTSVSDEIESVIRRANVIANRHLAMVGV